MTLFGEDEKYDYWIVEAGLFGVIFWFG